MTVKELIELNQMIVDVEITIRQNGTALVDQLNIGPSEGVKPPHPFRVPKKPEYINGCNRTINEFYKDAAYVKKSINSWDDGRDYWQVKVNRIPKTWLDLEVFSWEVWPASTVGVPRRSDGRFKNVNFHGQLINIVALPSGEVMTIKEPKEPEAQLDGQMNIEEWLKEGD